MSTLLEETQQPPDNVHMTSPGEFAAFWNSMDEAGRQTWLDQTRVAYRESSECWMNDHAGRLTEMAAELHRERALRFSDLAT